MNLQKQLLLIGLIIGSSCVLGGLAIGIANGPLGLIVGLGGIGILTLVYQRQLRQALHQVYETLFTGRHMARQVGQVDWSGPLKNEGLQGDWLRLFFVWGLEQSPATLGTWSTHPKDGAPLVTITAPEYIHDLKSRPQYQEALRGFRERCPRLESIRPGDRWEPWFQFTGHGTTTGEYTQVEWFLGSYLTTFVVTDIDLVTRTVGVEVAIENSSNLRSGTRLPDTWQARGLPVSVLPSIPRDAVGPVDIEFHIGPITAGPVVIGPIEAGTVQLGPVGLGGTFWQRFVWQDRIHY